MSSTHIECCDLNYDTANDSSEALMTVSRNICALEDELKKHKQVLREALTTRAQYLEGVIWQLGKAEAEALVQAPIEF